ncbi:MAG TPA: hypothetical protein VNO74_03015, partial [Methylomirabilota bacterium]|nr:hypothetical protein [Methylomirabilota bacterium]
VGAAAGCLGAAALLRGIDAPSAMLVISAVLLFSGWAYSSYARVFSRQRIATYAILLLVLAGLNRIAPNGIQPLWSKGQADDRNDYLYELWNPLSRVRASKVIEGLPLLMWGAPKLPNVQTSSIRLDIDNEAATPVYRYTGEKKDLDFLGYDVTSIAYRLRPGGSAAIIGVGGGRDLMTAAEFGFLRIVGIEINPGIIDLTMRLLKPFDNIDKVPGVEVHLDEGRSYLTRTPEKFDVIQASMVDTWAATSAGAMTLSENSLYTVEGWRIFYQRLKPGGVITFTRWNDLSEKRQTYRMFALAWATLLSEGVADPGLQLALVGGNRVATILVSNRPFSQPDLDLLRFESNRLGFTFLYEPGQRVSDPELKSVTSARSIGDLRTLHWGPYDYSPVFDDSPFFFNSLRLRSMTIHDFFSMIRTSGINGNLRALLFVMMFMIATLFLVGIAIWLPLTRWAELPERMDYVAGAGILYFIAIGLGFMLVEMAMMQQLSILLGHPIYSLVVVLTGLILSTGVGSLISENLSLSSDTSSHAPAFVTALIVIAYSVAVVPVIHQFSYLGLIERAGLSLALVAPCGIAMGFCFPIGLRWVKAMGQSELLPWMWALNGAASVLGSFVAILISMQSSITASVVTGAALYLLAGIALPWTRIAMRGATPQKSELDEMRSVAV